MTIIRTTRFDSARERRAKLAREYEEGMRELNARYPEQLDATRGPDCIDEDVRFIMRGLAAGLIVGLVLTGWKFWPAFEKILGLAN